MSFDIKFTRQDFENACWHREACRGIQHAFSKTSLVNLISKDANLVFYLSVYPLFYSSNYRLWRNFRFLYSFSIISDVIQKAQRHHDLIKVHAVRSTTFIRQRATMQLIWEVSDKTDCCLGNAIRHGRLWVGWELQYIFYWSTIHPSFFCCKTELHLSSLRA